MENDLEKYRVYQYIRSQELPEIVIEHFLTNIDPSGQGYGEYTQLLLDELKDLFSIVDDVHGTPDQSTFMSEGYFEAYQAKSIEILERGYLLLNNERIDEIIYNLATTNEGHSTLIEQRRLCALDIQKLFFEFLFSDHYEAVGNSTSFNEINKIILEARKAKSQIALKYDPEYIPTEDIKQLATDKTVALIEYAEFIKELRWGQLVPTMTSDSTNQPDLQKKPVLRVNENKIDITFEDLFDEPYSSHVSKFVDILRLTIPPLISDRGEWIGHKNAARIYFNTLKSHGIIKANTTQREAHYALGKKFPNLGSSFMKKPSKPTKADETYYEIASEIKNLKEDIITQSH